MNDRLVTIPNILSLLRLVGVPVYFLLVSDGRFVMAVLLLFAAGATDYFDGKIARQFNQTSKLGELLDPAADRLYIVAIIYSLWDLKIIPLFLLVLIFGRDLILAFLLIILKRRDFPPFKVTYLGKAATFNLLYAFPFLLLTSVENEIVSQTAFVLGWAFSAWGVALYLWTGGAYLANGVGLLKGSKRLKELRN